MGGPFVRDREEEKKITYSVRIIGFLLPLPAAATSLTAGITIRTTILTT